MNITPFTFQVTLTTAYALLATNTTSLGSARCLKCDIVSNSSLAADANVLMYSGASALPGQSAPLNLTISGQQGMGLCASGPIILAPGFGLYAKASANDRLAATGGGEIVTP